MVGVGFWGIVGGYGGSWGVWGVRRGGRREGGEEGGRRREDGGERQSGLRELVVIVGSREKSRLLRTDRGCILVFWL